MLMPGVFFIIFPFNLIELFFFSVQYWNTPQFAGLVRGCIDLVCEGVCGIGIIVYLPRLKVAPTSIHPSCQSPRETTQQLITCSHSSFHCQAASQLANSQSFSSNTDVGFLLVWHLLHAAQKQYWFSKEKLHSSKISLIYMHACLAWIMGVGVYISKTCQIKK